MCRKICCLHITTLHKITRQAGSGWWQQPGVSPVRSVYKALEFLRAQQFSGLLPFNDTLSVCVCVCVQVRVRVLKKTLQKKISVNDHIFLGLLEYKLEYQQKIDFYSKIAFNNIFQIKSVHIKRFIQKIIVKARPSLKRKII